MSAEDMAAGGRKAMERAKNAFLVACAEPAGDPQGKIERVLDGAFEYGRLRCLHPELARLTWSADDERCLRATFHAVCRLIADHKHDTWGMAPPDRYRALRHCSGLTFVAADFWPLFASAESDELALEEVKEEWEDALYLRSTLLFEVQDWVESPLSWYAERNLDPSGHRLEPDSSMLPPLAGVPASHDWWARWA